MLTLCVKLSSYLANDPCGWKLKSSLNPGFKGEGISIAFCGKIASFTALNMWHHRVRCIFYIQSLMLLISFFKKSLWYHSSTFAILLLFLLFVATSMKLLDLVGFPHLIIYSDHRKKLFAWHRSSYISIQTRWKTYRMSTIYFLSFSLTLLCTPTV